MASLLKRTRSTPLIPLFLALLLTLFHRSLQVTPEQNIQGVQAPTSKPTPSVSVSDTAQASQSGHIVRVVDGDTVVVSINGQNQTVRIIGINSPESVDPRKPVECFGKEAAAHARALLENQSVQVIADPTQADRDKYKRLLRSIELHQGKDDFGLMMIADGFAYEYTYDLPYRQQTVYKQAQQQAQQQKKGLWADTACPAPRTP